MITKPLTIAIRHDLATLAIKWTKQNADLTEIGNGAIIAVVALQSQGVDAIQALRVIRNGFRLASNPAAANYIDDQIHDVLWAEGEQEPMWT
jgi:hypothetical protein